MKNFVSIMIALNAVACGTESQQSNTLASEPTIVTIDEGAFKLYDNEDVVTEAFCDLHLLLTLKNTETGSLAVFENAVSGICEIAVNPNPRTYVLNEVKGTCGSRVFEGKLLNPAKGEANSVVITDHRARFCKDLVPSSIVVEKTYALGSIKKLFSLDNRALTLDTAEGTLTRMMAIGGESTGYGLQLNNGSLIELELSADILPSFVEDQKVEVAGTFKTVRGIETHIRQVLVVKTITAI
jgi:hypothetical protein